MSIQAVGWALEQELPPGPKLVLVSIANHADHTDGYCWLRTETIAKESSYEERNIYRTVAALVRNGYLRREKKRGADGKQRANDYWILFDREPVEWAWRTSDTADGEPQDVVGGNSPGDSCATTPTDSSVENDAPGLAQVSVGPTDSGGVPLYTEPSKTKPKKDSISGLAGRAPRGYRPPSLAVVAAAKPDPVFVVEGTRAWHAWLDHRKRNKLPPINATYRGAGDNANKTGRHFPSLFPPNTESTGPPNPLCTDEDLRDFAQSKIG